MIKDFEQFVNENEARFQQGFKPVYDLLDEMKDVMSVEDILARLINKLDPRTAFEYLQDIKNVEIGDLD